MKKTLSALLLSLVSFSASAHFSTQTYQIHESRLRALDSMPCKDAFQSMIVLSITIGSSIQDAISLIQILEATGASADKIQEVKDALKGLQQLQAIGMATYQVSCIESDKVIGTSDSKNVTCADLYTSAMLAELEQGAQVSKTMKLMAKMKSDVTPEQLIQAEAKMVASLAESDSVSLAPIVKACVKNAMISSD